MNHPKTVTRTLLLGAALAFAAPAVSTSTASAAAACQVDGGSSMGDTPNEWSVIVTFLAKGVTCKQAKAVINKCANRDTVPGWKYSKQRFTSRTNAKKRFAVQLAGGSPQCISHANGF